MRFIRRSDIPFVWRLHVNVHPDGHQHGGWKPSPSSATEFCDESRKHESNTFSRTLTVQIAKLPKIIRFLNLHDIEYTECTSSFFRNLAASVGSNHATRSDPPSRKQGWIPRKTISQGKALVCPQKGNWAFFWIFSFHLCLLSVYFQSSNTKL